MMMMMMMMMKSLRSPMASVSVRRPIDTRRMHGTQTPRKSSFPSSSSPISSPLLLPSSSHSSFSISSASSVMITPIRRSHMTPKPNFNSSTKTESQSHTDTSSQLTNSIITTTTTNSGGNNTSPGGGSLHHSHSHQQEEHKKQKTIITGWINAVHEQLSSRHTQHSDDMLSTGFFIQPSSSSSASAASGGGGGGGLRPSLPANNWSSGGDTSCGGASSASAAASASTVHDTHRTIAATPRCRSCIGVVDETVLLREGLQRVVGEVVSLLYLSTNITSSSSFTSLVAPAGGDCSQSGGGESGHVDSKTAASSRKNIHLTRRQRSQQQQQAALEQQKQQEERRRRHTAIITAMHIRWRLQQRFIEYTEELRMASDYETMIDILRVLTADVVDLDVDVDVGGGRGKIRGSSSEEDRRSRSRGGSGSDRGISGCIDLRGGRGSGGGSSSSGRSRSRGGSTSGGGGIQPWDEVSQLVLYFFLFPNTSTSYSSLLSSSSALQQQQQQPIENGGLFSTRVLEKEKNKNNSQREGRCKHGSGDNNDDVKNMEGEGTTEDEQHQSQQQQQQQRILLSAFADGSNHPLFPLWLMLHGATTTTTTTMTTDDGAMPSATERKEMRQEEQKRKQEQDDLPSLFSILVASEVYNKVGRAQGGSAHGGGGGNNSCEGDKQSTGRRAAADGDTGGGDSGRIGSSGGNRLENSSSSSASMRSVSSTAPRPRLSAFGGGLERACSSSTGSLILDVCRLLRSLRRHRHRCSSSSLTQEDNDEENTTGNERNQRNDEKEVVKVKEEWETLLHRQKQTKDNLREQEGNLLARERERKDRDSENNKVDENENNDHEKGGDRRVSSSSLPSYTSIFREYLDAVLDRHQMYIKMDWIHHHVTLETGTGTTTSTTGTTTMTTATSMKEFTSQHHQQLQQQQQHHTHTEIDPTYYGSLLRDVVVSPRHSMLPPFLAVRLAANVTDYITSVGGNQQQQHQPLIFYDALMFALSFSPVGFYTDNIFRRCRRLLYSLVVIGHYGAAVGGSGGDNNGIERQRRRRRRRQQKKQGLTLRQCVSLLRYSISGGRGGGGWASRIGGGGGGNINNTPSASSVHQQNVLLKERNPIGALITREILRRVAMEARLLLPSPPRSISRMGPTTEDFLRKGPSPRCTNTGATHDDAVCEEQGREELSCTVSSSSPSLLEEDATLSEREKVVGKKWEVTADEEEKAEEEKDLDLAYEATLIYLSTAGGGMSSFLGGAFLRSSSTPSKKKVVVVGGNSKGNKASQLFAVDAAFVDVSDGAVLRALLQYSIARCWSEEAPRVWTNTVKNKNKDKDNKKQMTDNDDYERENDEKEYEDDGDDNDVVVDADYFVNGSDDHGDTVVRLPQKEEEEEKGPPQTGTDREGEVEVASSPLPLRTSSYSSSSFLSPSPSPSVDVNVDDRVSLNTSHGGMVTSTTLTLEDHVENIISLAEGAIAAQLPSLCASHLHRHFSCNIITAGNTSGGGPPPDLLSSSSGDIPLENDRGRVVLSQKVSNSNNNPSQPPSTASYPAAVWETTCRSSRLGRRLTAVLLRLPIYFPPNGQNMLVDMMVKTEGQQMQKTKIITATSTTPSPTPTSTSTSTPSTTSTSTSTDDDASSWSQMSMSLQLLRTKLIAAGLVSITSTVVSSSSSQSCQRLSAGEVAEYLRALTAWGGLEGGIRNSKFNSSQSVMIAPDNGNDNDGLSRRTINNQGGATCEMLPTQQQQSRPTMVSSQHHQRHRPLFLQLTNRQWDAIEGRLLDFTIASSHVGGVGLMNYSYNDGDSDERSQGGGDTHNMTKTSSSTSPAAAANMTTTATNIDDYFERYFYRQRNGLLLSGDGDGGGGRGGGAGGNDADSQSSLHQPLTLNDIVAILGSLRACFTELLLPQLCRLREEMLLYVVREGSEDVASTLVPTSSSGSSSTSSSSLSSQDDSNNRENKEDETQREQHHQQHCESMNINNSVSVQSSSGRTAALVEQAQQEQQQQQKAHIQIQKAEQAQAAAAAVAVLRRRCSRIQREYTRIITGIAARLERVAQAYTSQLKHKIESCTLKEMMAVMRLVVGGAGTGGARGGGSGDGVGARALVEFRGRAPARAIRSDSSSSSHHTLDPAASSSPLWATVTDSNSMISDSINDSTTQRSSSSSSSISSPSAMDAEVLEALLPGSNYLLRLMMVAKSSASSVDPVGVRSGIHQEMTSATAFAFNGVVSVSATGASSSTGTTEGTGSVSSYQQQPQPGPGLSLSSSSSIGLLSKVLRWSSMPLEDRFVDERVLLSADSLVSHVYNRGKHYDHTQPNDATAHQDGVLSTNKNGMENYHQGSSTGGSGKTTGLSTRVTLPFISRGANHQRQQHHQHRQQSQHRGYFHYHTVRGKDILLFLSYFSRRHMRDMTGVRQVAHALCNLMVDDVVHDVPSSSSSLVAGESPSSSPSSMFTPTIGADAADARRGGGGGAVGVAFGDENINLLVSQRGRHHDLSLTEAVACLSCLNYLRVDHFSLSLALTQHIMEELEEISVGSSSSPLLTIGIGNVRRAESLADGEKGVEKDGEQLEREELKRPVERDQASSRVVSSSSPNTPALPLSLQQAAIVASALDQIDVRSGGYRRALLSYVVDNIDVFLDRADASPDGRGETTNSENEDEQFYYDQEQEVDPRGDSVENWQLVDDSHQNRDGDDDFLSYV